MQYRVHNTDSPVQYRVKIQFELQIQFKVPKYTVQHVNGYVLLISPTFYFRREREKSAGSRAAGTINSVSKIDNIARLQKQIVLPGYKYRQYGQVTLTDNIARLQLKKVT